MDIPRGWQDVFNAQRLLGMAFHEAAGLAHRAGYPFMAFNGGIFRIIPDEQDPERLLLKSIKGVRLEDLDGGPERQVPLSESHVVLYLEKRHGRRCYVLARMVRQHPDLVVAKLVIDKPPQPGREHLNATPFELWENGKQVAAEPQVCLHPVGLYSTYFEDMMRRWQAIGLLVRPGQLLEEDNGPTAQEGNHGHPGRPEPHGGPEYPGL